MTRPGSGAGTPIDVAFVEIVPDTSGFSAALRRGTRDAFDDLERTAERAADNIERSLDDAAQSISESFDDAAANIDASFDRAASNIDSSLDSVDDSSRRLHKNIDDRARDSADLFDKEGDRIGDALVDNFAKANKSSGILQNSLGKLGEALVSIGSAIVGLGASAPTPAGLIAIGAAIAGIVSLLPVVLALVAALADLAGLLAAAPAGFAVLAAAIAPLVIAFNGFGDAIGAILEKDPEKIKEALDKLSPSARKVAKEFQKLVPAFERLGDVVQESLFSRLQGSLTSVVNSLLPTLQAGLSRVGSALGDLGAAFARILAAPATRNTLASIFATTESVIRTLTPAVSKLFTVLISAVQAGLPFVERIGTALGNAISQFAGFLSTSLESGSFQSFFEDAVATVKELVDLGKALGGLFVAVFSDLDDSGRGFIGTLANLVTELTAFFQSAEGQDFLGDVKQVVTAVGIAVGVLADALVFLLGLLGQVDDAAAATGRFFSDLGNSIANGFNAVVAFLGSLPGRVLSALQALPGLVLDLFNFLVDESLRAIGRGIGLIIFAFTELPRMTRAAVDALPGILLELWQTTFNNSIAFIRNALNTIVQIVPGLLSQAVELGRQVVVTGFSNIVDFVRSVPGRIRDAFLSAGNLVVSIGNAIGAALKSVINRAIDRINEGIAEVDRVLPGNLPRIPRLAHGGVSTDPMLAAISETGQNEAVLPLEDPRAMRMIGRAIADAGGLGSGTLFGPGSIVIQFAGVVPTPGEAQQVGRNVGVGMAAALARRDARLGVRTL